MQRCLQISAPRPLSLGLRPRPPPASRGEVYRERLSSLTSSRGSLRGKGEGPVLIAVLPADLSAAAPLPRPPASTSPRFAGRGVPGALVFPHEFEGIPQG